MIKRLFGFTLAEVLITLGIIGVVAAMTIPTLMANIRAKQYISKYKKALATLSNAARMSESQYGFDFSGINDYCSKDSATDNPENKHSLCALLNGTLQGATFYYGLNSLGNYEYKLHFSIHTIDSYKTTLPIYQLSDGTLIVFSGRVSGAGAFKGCTRSIGGKPWIRDDGYGNGCYGFIDVNGTSLPNTETKCSNGNDSTGVFEAGDCIVKHKDIGDIFMFTFYDGSAMPYSNSDWAAYNSK